MSETNVMRRILLRASRLLGVTVFRNNVGLGWAGKLVNFDRATGRVVLAHARPVKFGLCNGSSDVIGWRSRVITPDMVGQTVAVFAAVEVKDGKGTNSTEQDAFGAAVKAAGGIYGVARSEADAEAILTGRLS